MAQKIKDYFRGSRIFNSFANIQQLIAYGRLSYENFLNNTLLLVLLTKAGLVVFIIGSTYGEVTSLASTLSACETSGCSRSTGLGVVFLFILMPVVVLVFSGLLFSVIMLNCKLAQPKSRTSELFFLTIFPFIGTSIIFPWLTHLIYEPGYQTDLRFLAFVLVKMGLLLLNALILFFSLFITCRLGWIKTVIISMLPFILFGFIFIEYFSEIKPYLHYLSEQNTYELAKYYLLR